MTCTVADGRQRASLKPLQKVKFELINDADTYQTSRIK